MRKYGGRGGGECRREGRGGEGRKRSMIKEEEDRRGI